MKKMKNKTLVTVICSVVLLVGVIVGIYFIFFSPNVNTKMVYNEFVIEKGHAGNMAKYDPSIYVEGYKGNKEEAYYINGKIVSEKDYNFVLITFDLYDKEDNLLGIAQAGLSNIKKGESYDFKALSLTIHEDTKKISDYKINNIMGN